VAQNLDALHCAIDCHDRDAGVNDRLHRWGERLGIPGRYDNAVDSLGDRRLKVGRLRRRIVLAILYDQLDIELGGLLFGNVHHMHEEGEVETRYREDDLELFVLPGRGRGARQGYADQQTEQESHHQQACGHPLFTHRCLLCKSTCKCRYHALRTWQVACHGFGGLSALTRLASVPLPVGQRCPGNDLLQLQQSGGHPCAPSSFLLRMSRSSPCVHRGRLAAVDGATRRPPSYWP
jgi:hypothetical protein